MNIAMASYYLPPRDRIGAGYMMHYLANEYVKAGHRVTMFSQPREKADDALYELSAVQVGERNRTFRFSWNLRQIDFSGFDLLHTGGDVCWLVGKRRPFHVVTYHGSCLAEAMHSATIRGKVRMFALAILEYATCFVADRKVCVSRNTRRYIPFAREIIGNGVDKTVFRPGPGKSPKPSILFIGTMDSRKRGKELLDIFRREVRLVIPDAELWIVREERPIEEEGVRWFGPVSQDKLIDLYQRAWVFCLPSSYEGFGVPYIEAMACGTAVVATANDGALEVLENGRYGRIAALEGIGTEIITLLSNESERTALERMGLTRSEHFSWERVVNSYVGCVSRGESSR